jgi:hypothetical protein
MASTRNKNSQGDYKLEQWSNTQDINYKTYTSFGKPISTYLPGDGLLAGRVGATELSHNNHDIESFLFGIGSTNLVNPNTQTVPEIKPLKSVSIIDRLPVMIPDPLVIEPNQRPSRYLP